MRPCCVAAERIGSDSVTRQSTIMRSGKAGNWRRCHFQKLIPWKLAWFEQSQKLADLRGRYYDSVRL